MDEAGVVSHLVAADAGVMIVVAVVVAAFDGGAPLCGGQEH